MQYYLGTSLNYLKHIVEITCVYLHSTRGSTQISVNTRFYKNLIICQNMFVKLTPSLTRLLIILIEIIFNSKCLYVFVAIENKSYNE